MLSTMWDFFLLACQRALVPSSLSLNNILTPFKIFNAMIMSVLRVAIYLICVWLCLCNLPIRIRSELRKMTTRKREFPSVLPSLGKFCDWHWEKQLLSQHYMLLIVLHYTASSNATAQFNFFTSVCLLAAVLDYQFWKTSLSGLFYVIFLSYIISQRNNDFCYNELNWDVKDCFFICTFHSFNDHQKTFGAK